MLRLEVDRTMSSRVSSSQKPSNISTCSSGTDKPSIFCEHHLRLRLTDALDCLAVRNVQFLTGFLDISSSMSSCQLVFNF
jgi:hypothetical protein